MKLVALNNIAVGSGVNRKFIPLNERFDSDDYPVVTQAELDTWLYHKVVRRQSERNEPVGFTSEK